MADLPTLRRRRGTVKASITKLTIKVAELEARDSDPSVIGHAQQLLKRLEMLDANFKTHQLAIIDIQEGEQLGAEQEALDKHDDDVMELSLRLQALSVPQVQTPVATGTPLLPDRTVIERRLVQLQSRFAAINGDVGRLTCDPSEVHMIYLYQEQLSDLKRELSDLRNEVLVIADNTSDPLCTAIQVRDGEIFDMSVKVNRYRVHARLALIAIHVSFVTTTKNCYKYKNYCTLQPSPLKQLDHSHQNLVVSSYPRSMFPCSMGNY